MYDLATLTPVERPAGTPLVLTDEQAAKLEKEVAARKSYQDAPINADRSAPPVGGDGSVGAAGNVGGYNSFWIDSGSRYSVIDGQRRASILIDPPDGRVPPMTQAARGSASRATCGRPPISRAREDDPGFEGAGAYDDPERRPLGERCLMGFGSTSGPPVLPNYFYNNLHQIVQTRRFRADPDRDGPRRARRSDERRARCRKRSGSGWAIRLAAGKATHWSSTRRTSPTRRAIADPRRTCTSSSDSRASTPKTLLYRFTVEDPEHVGEAVDGRIHVAGDRRADVRIRVPRRQLRAGQHPARRAAEGSGRSQENEAVR